jgi:hypothetical protein
MPGMSAKPAPPLGDQGTPGSGAGQLPEPVKTDSIGSMAEAHLVGHRMLRFPRRAD